MGWIVLTVFLWLIVAAGVVTYRVARPNLVDARRHQAHSLDDERRAVPLPVAHRWALAVAAVAAVVWLLATGLASFKQVDTGNIGIVKSFGQITGSMGAGVNVKAPWESVDTVNVQTQCMKFATPDRSDAGAARCQQQFPTIGAGSRDNQPTAIRMTLNWSIAPGNAPKLYREVGGNFVDKLIPSRVLQASKDEAARYSAVDLVPHREDYRRAVLRRLKAVLQPFSIDVQDVNIDDIDFSPKFNAAIEEKVTAQQRAQTEKNNVQVAQYQAEQKVATAKGDADATTVQAKANATNRLIAAQAEARSNALVAHSLTPAVLQARAIDKLNPNVQTVLVPSAGNTLFDVSKLAGAGR